VGEGRAQGKGEWGWLWWLYFVFIYEYRRLKPVEIALRKGRKWENDGGGKSKIYWKHICKYHNVSPCTTIIC
jgi:hypothetical protein